MRDEYRRNPDNPLDKLLKNENNREAWVEVFRLWRNLQMNQYGSDVFWTSLITTARLLEAYYQPSIDAWNRDKQTNHAWDDVAKFIAERMKRTRHRKRFNEPGFIMNKPADVIHYLKLRDKSADVPELWRSFLKEYKRNHARMVSANAPGEKSKNGEGRSVEEKAGF